MGGQVGGSDFGSAISGIGGLSVWLAGYCPYIIYCGNLSGQDHWMAVLIWFFLLRFYFIIISAFFIFSVLFTLTAETNNYIFLILCFNSIAFCLLYYLYFVYLLLL